MNRLEFRLGSLEGQAPGVRTVIPWIDGRPLLDIVRDFETAMGFDVPGEYDGIVPAFFRFGPLEEHYLGKGPRTGHAQVLGCGCGEAGCWPLFVAVTAGPGTVTWSEFEQPHRPGRDYSGLGPLVFERAAYDAACSAVAKSLLSA